MTEYIRDTLAVVSVAAIGIGAGQFHFGAGLIVTGGLVLAGLLFIGGRKHDDS